MFAASGRIALEIFQGSAGMNNALTRRGIVLAMVQTVLWLSGILSEQSFGQTLDTPEAEEPKLPATTLALMDVAYIFKNHKRFNEQMKEIQRDALDVQQKIAATNAQLELLKGRLSQTTDESEKEKLEVELATQTTQHQIYTRKLQLESQKAEATLYYETYMLLQVETKKYCRSRGIHVVLKSTRDEIKRDDRNSIMQGLARPIVFSDAPDISDDVLKAMAASAEVNAAKAKAEETKSR
jgi:Skp family chaperone for outer membrane proteins